MNYRERKKVARKMEVVAIGFVILFLSVAVYFNHAIEDLINENIKESLQREAQATAQDVNAYFVKYAEVVNQMHTNSLLTTYIASVTNEASRVKNDQYDQVVNELRLIKASNDSIALAWIGLEEENTLVTNNHLWKIDDGYDITKRPWHIEMLKGDETIVFTSPYIDTGTGKMVLSIVSPIYSEGSLVGNVGIDIEIADAKQLVKSQYFGKSGYVYLMSNSSSFVAEPKSYNRMDLAMKETVLSIWDTDETRIFTSYDGDRLLASAEVDVNGWRVGSSILLGEMNGIIHNFRIIIGMLVFLSILIIVIFEVIIRFTSDIDELNKTNRLLSEKERILQKKHIEITSAYEQLALSEEELRAQYDEIQVYSSKIRQLNEKYDLVIELTNSAIWEYNFETENISFSNGNYRMDDLKVRDGFLPDIIKNNIYHEDADVLKSTLHDVFQNHQDELYCHFRLKNNDGGFRWTLLHGKRMHDEKHFSGLLLDISKLKAQEEKIVELAYTDPLTGIPNRRKFIETIEKALDQEKHGAIILLDLDNFKEINDTLGHVYGDKVLHQVAEKINAISNDDVFVSRFGGDEFLIQLNNHQSKEAITSFVKKLQGIFTDRIVVEDEEVYLGMSIGISMYPEDSSDVNSLIMNADMAMYDVKSTGKNSYAFFDDTMLRELQRKADIEKRMRTAIKEDDFYLVYQPQFVTGTSEIIGYEALIRMKDHSLSPGEFIGVCEESKLIHDIGRLVTRKVMGQLKEWQEEGYPVKPVAINFSPKQLNDRHYIEYIDDLLKEYGISPDLIELEITENILLENQLDTLSYLNKLSDIGIKMSLDDFGTGYSSINYLSFLPVEKVKLDKSLSDKFLNNEEDSVVTSIISLAHQLGLKVIAEGIEKASQVESLMMADCDAIQGYYYSKPLQAKDVFRGV